MKKGQRQPVMSTPSQTCELNPLFLCQKISSKPPTEKGSVYTDRLEIDFTCSGQLREVCLSSWLKRRLKEPEARQIQIQSTMYIFNTKS